MSAPTSFKRVLDLRVPRRLLTFGGLILFAGIGVALSPVLLGAAFLVDLVRRDRRRARTRFVLLILGSMLIELWGLIRLFIYWVATGFGLAHNRRWTWHLHRNAIGWYTNSLLTLVAWVLGTRVDWRDHADTTHGPVVLIARHTSFFDALIPATVLARRAELLPHHVLTRGLRLAPCIDTLGHRFPNRFISRIPNEAGAEVPAIRAIGEHLNESSSAVIFPEGTFRTPERFERAMRAIRERAPEHAAKSAALRHMLPPRPAGTQALLAGAPDADLIVCTNTGLEPFGSIRSIVDAPVADRPIIVETWRIPRASIPDVEDHDAFSSWMLDEFHRIDEWVESHRHDVGVLQD